MSTKNSDLSPKREHPTEKTRLHPRNRHRERYDFATLIGSYPNLSAFVTANIHGDDSIDFANPLAVRALNTALLIHYYDLISWELPDSYLCPPIPGRADYIHHIATLLGQKNFGKVPIGDKIKVLDIGVGASCIYPIIGIKEYGWSFIGSDMDSISIQSSEKIVHTNPSLSDKVELRLQPDAKDIFKNIIKPDENIDLVISNPPFHGSLAEAQSGTKRKLKNLKLDKTPQPILNFGGQQTELWCEGGEEEFVQTMIAQSKQYAKTVCWFSSLISKQSNLRRAENALHIIGAKEIKIIPMGQGNKSSRILAWTFLGADDHKEWAKNRWI
jgi:23S rRNA (adenine1618-N6)-methyltransferase